MADKTQSATNTEIADRQYIGGERIQTHVRDGKDEHERTQSGEDGWFEAFDAGRKSERESLYPSAGS